MNNKTQYILIALCSVLGACSSEEVPVTIPQQDTETMTFSVAMNGDNSDEVNVVPYFKKGDQIRLYNPVSYSTPDFTDYSPTAYIYECDSARTALDEEYPYKFIPFNSKGFKWKNLNPTSIYYMFEAAYFPGNKYFNEVPSDQSTEENFKNADLLLTHHGQLISEQDTTVKLKFHHAFAMVQVKVKLPVSEFPDQGMFPENALKGVYMRAMLRNYEVDYSGVIDNDALRTVRVPKNDEALPVNNPKRKNIQMYCSSRTAPTPETDNTGKEVIYQGYIFQGIVPEQNFLNEGNDFLYFQVKRHDAEEVLYKFKTETLTLKSSHILNLTLSIDSNTLEIIVLTAEVKPWNTATVDDMEIGPVTPTN